MLCYLFLVFQRSVELCRSRGPSRGLVSRHQKPYNIKSVFSGAFRIFYSDLMIDFQMNLTAVFKNVYDLFLALVELNDPLTTTWISLQLWQWRTDLALLVDAPVSVFKILFFYRFRIRKILPRFWKRKVIIRIGKNACTCPSFDRVSPVTYLQVNI